jgi:hypothetical protein
MPASKQALLRANHDLIEALWRDKATDLDIVIELEATRGIEVSTALMCLYRNAYEMPAWRDRPRRPRALDDVQHYRLLRQYHVDWLTYMEMMAYWSISKPTVYSYLWVIECSHPDAAKIKRRPKGNSAIRYSKIPPEERPFIIASTEPSRVLAERYGVTPTRILQIKRAA